MLLDENDFGTLPGLIEAQDEHYYGDKGRGSGKVISQSLTRGTAVLRSGSGDIQRTIKALREIARLLIQKDIGRSVGSEKVSRQSSLMPGLRK